MTKLYDTPEYRNNVQSFESRLHIFIADIIHKE